MGVGCLTFESVEQLLHFVGQRFPLVSKPTLLVAGE